MNNIVAIIKSTLSEYGNREYVKITGDKYMEKVPDALWKLWYSDANHNMALSNTEYYFYRAQNDKDDMAVFCANLSELRHNLAYEFNLLINRAVAIDNC